MKNNAIKGQKVGKIMQINANSTELIEVLTWVEDFISHSSEIGTSNKKFSIVTPNPELVLMAQEDQKLKKALNSADLSVPDGIGLSQADKYFSLWLPKNKFLKFFVGLFQGLRVGTATFFDRNWLTSDVKPIKGRELFLDLVKLADKNKWKVFFLGGLGDEAELAAKKLQERYKDIKILSDQGQRLNNQAKPLTKKDVEIEKRIIDKINKFTPQLLFVAFGNPKQEIWVHEHLSSLNIGGAMCVGGTFRYIAGISKLPPKWMAKMDLEWLWRLFTEPKRFGRVFRAVIIFPLKCFIDKISK